MLAPGSLHDLFLLILQQASLLPTTRVAATALFISFIVLITVCGALDCLLVNKMFNYVSMRSPNPGANQWG